MFDKETSPFSRLYQSFKAGDMSRRSFMHRATALGMGAGMAMAMADAVAQVAPAAGDAAPVNAFPCVGTENQVRGEGGELKIIQWQAPTQLIPLFATGDKDNMAAQLVMEPLMSRDREGHFIPRLITQVPSIENGLLAEDFTSVTYTLLDGVKWSDGEPFTAEDVKFTVEFANDPENPVVHGATFKRIIAAEVIDELTVKLTFDTPNATWSGSFTGNGAGCVYPKHVLEGADEARLNEYRVAPIGTGPFKVESFEVSDQVTYVINEHYREPNKPYFDRVILKGGGDAAAAARATLLTGEYDFAGSLSVERDVMEGILADGNSAHFVVESGLNIDRININFSDPDTVVDGQRSEMNTPHPILSELAVRKALQLGIDRVLISEKLYMGMDAEPAVANILSGIPSTESPNTELKYDPEEAAALLEEAGWVLDGAVRKKDGLALKLRLVSAASPIRQKVQAIVKANLEEIGFSLVLDQVDAAIYLDNAAGNEQNISHFYTDLNTLSSSVWSMPPVGYMNKWYAGDNRIEIPQKSNNWVGRNFQRYMNDEFDALYEATLVEGDMEKAAEMFIKMNDILWNDAAVLPILRQAKKSAVSKRLNLENVGLHAFEYDYYNIANWNCVSE